jgi:hypothetical protein
MELDTFGELQLPKDFVCCTLGHDLHSLGRATMKQIQIGIQTLDSAGTLIRQGIGQKGGMPGT